MKPPWEEKFWLDPVCCSTWGVSPHAEEAMYVFH